VSVVDPGRESSSLARLYLIAGSLALLAAALVSGVFARPAAAVVVLATVAAASRITSVGWPRLFAALIVIILLIPIRRYALPGSLPFQLEPYRVFVILLVVGWGASLLVDRRVRPRWTGFEWPLGVIVAAMVASIVANPGRVQEASVEVSKSFTFFLSFLLLLYVFASTIRRLDDVDRLAKTLVSAGAVVALFAVVEARTGFNVFNHLGHVFPFLRDLGDVGGFQRLGTAKLRVFASAQHPIALSAALVMLSTLAFYLARRHRQRRWILCLFLFAAACASTVSRTGIVMFVVAALVFLWLRPRETRRLWPAVLPLLVAIHFVLPGTLGAIKQSFFPAGGLVAEQRVSPGSSGSGRLADLGPAIEEWKVQPLVGQGFGTRVIYPTRGFDTRSNILDDQWLGTLLETGALGALGWVWFFVRAVRRFGAEAKRDGSDRGWLLASLAAGVAAYGVGMLTYDAFSFIQVTFLLFIFVGLGSAVLAESPIRLAAGEDEIRPARPAPATYSND
jgi:O-antigen ligase